MRKGNPTLAYSPVSDRRRLTALEEVHRERRVQAPESKSSEPNQQENQVIETCKEEGCTVSTQETAARKKWKGRKFDKFIGSLDLNCDHKGSHNDLLILTF
jgi:hypothetical protein